MASGDIQLDKDVLRMGSISKYFKNSVLNEDLEWFTNNHFDVIDIDVRCWNQKNVHKNLKNALRFPDYYGENLDAFADCLRDLYSSRHQGIVLVFRHYDDFINESKELAEAILDLIVCESRYRLVDQHKLLILIQSGDPDLSISKLGGITPNWNSSEWFNSSRED